MTITATQAAERAKGIGSSDAAAVMGLSPFLTPYELWMQKTGRSEGFAGNEATKRGDILEPAILEMVAVEIEQKVVQPTSTFVKGILRANVDGMVGKFARGSTIVEAKSSVMKGDWGSPGTDEVPAHVLIQVMHQMICAESPEAIVAKLGFTMWPDIYYVPFDRELADLIEQSCSDFWNNHVVADTPPEITQANKSLLDAMIRVRRTKGGGVTVDPGLCRAYLDAKRVEADATAKAKAARAKLLAAIGDHADFEAPGFKTSITWVKGRTDVDRDLLKTNHPDVYAACLKTGGGYPKLNVKEMSE